VVYEGANVSGEMEYDEFLAALQESSTTGQKQDGTVRKMYRDITDITKRYNHVCNIYIYIH